jgi:hypothetical protein
VRDEEFESIMDAWAEHESESAPQMRPTADMYHMVEAKRKSGLLSLPLSPRAMLATAVASLMVLAGLYTGLFDPSMLFDRRSGQEVAVVRLREGFSSEKGVNLRGTLVPSRGGPNKGPICLAQLMFQFQKGDSRFVEGIDMQAPQEETVALTAADNYRLLLEPASDCYVYALQLTSSDVLVKLFPNETFHSAQNPLRRGQTYHLPSEPNWFYLDGDTGEERLYLVASVEALPDLQDLYAQYDQADDQVSKQQMLLPLLHEIESIAATHPNKAATWVFTFDQR